MPSLEVINMKSKGYIALTMILVIVSVVIALATTIALLSIGEGQASLAQQEGEESWNFIDGCAEDALLKIHDSSSYAGGTITRPEGSCSVTVISGNPNWNIKVTTTSTTYKRTVQILATRGSTITITSWLEGLF